MEQVTQNALCAAVGGEPVVNHCDPGSVCQHIFVDCTQTLVSGLNTGVQRVVRNLVTRMGQHAAKTPNEITVIPVVTLGGTIFHAPKLIFDADTHPSGASKSVRRLARLRRWLGDPAALVLGRFARKAYFFLTAHNVRRLKGGRVVFHPGDILLMLDICTDLSLKRPLTSAQKAGARIIFCHYDLIALSHPHLCSRSWVASFRRYFSSSIQFADGYLCISRAARDELSNYLVSLSPARAQEIRCQQFALGSDFSASQSSSRDFKKAAEMSPEDKALISHPIDEFFFQHAKVVLMVGTIEPRKNHRLSLQLLHRLANDQPELGILWLGRAGWRSKQIVREMRSSPLFPARLQWISAATDQDIHYAYQRAAALLFPSFAEGFGLPITEAARLGCPVIASDLPCHQELQMELVHCLPVNDIDAWERALRQLLEVSSSHRIQAGFAPGTQSHSWDESAAHALHLLSRFEDWPRAADTSKPESSAVPILGRSLW